MDILQRNSRKSRGLGKLGKRMRGVIAEIDSRLEKEEQIRILEVGCGYGVALLELKQIYGDRVDLHGINKKPSHGDRRTMATMAERRGLDGGFGAGAPPEIHFFDVCRPWPMAGGQFDVVFSQHAFLWFADKIRPLEEIDRVMKPGGRAYIDLLVDRSGPMRENSIVILDAKGKAVSFREHLKRFGGISVVDPQRSSMRKALRWVLRKFGVKRPPKDRPFLIMDKCGGLQFGLEFVSVSDFRETASGRKGRQSFYRAGGQSGAAPLDDRIDVIESVLRMTA